MFDPALSEKRPPADTEGQANRPREPHMNVSPLDLRQHVCRRPIRHVTIRPDDVLPRGCARWIEKGRLREQDKGTF